MNHKGSACFAGLTKKATPVDERDPEWAKDKRIELEQLGDFDERNVALRQRGLSTRSAPDRSSTLVSVGDAKLR